MIRFQNTVTLSRRGWRNQWKFPAVQGVTKIFGLGATQCYEYLTQFVDSIEMDIVDESGVEYNNLILGI